MPGPPVRRAHRCREHRCREQALTFLSSGGAVYGDVVGAATEGDACRPVSRYGSSKLAGEKLVADHAERWATPVAVLRVANAYGPTQTAANGQGVVAAFLHASLHRRPVALFDEGRRTACP